jgi:hypothetical protein
MGKSELTLDIERCLINKAVKNSQRYASEVSVGGGICDFVTIKSDYQNNNIPHVTCYEIKVSLQDFKSENGHNLVGDKNYYVVPKELYNELIEKGIIHNHNGYSYHYGVITYTKSTMKTVLKQRFETCELSLDDRFKLLDEMLMRWCRGGMTNLLKTINYELPTVKLSKERKEMVKRYKELYHND